MVEKRLAWHRIGPWLWVPVVVLIGAILSWQLLRLLPGWVEGTVEKALLETHIVPTAFTVEQVGLDKTVVGPGTLVYDLHSLSWDSIRAEYSLKDLATGRIKTLLAERPLVSIQLLPPTEGLPVLDLPVDEGTIPEAALLEPPLPSEETRPVPQQSPTQAADPEVAIARPVAEPVLDPLTGLRDRILEVPLEGYASSGGVLEILLQKEVLTRFEFDSQLERQPFGLSGELSLENELMAAHVSLRTPLAKPVVTVQGEAMLVHDSMVKIRSSLSPHYDFSSEIPELVSSGRMIMDMFLEFEETDGLYGSMEASMDDLGLRWPAWELDLSLKDLLIAGTLRGEMLALEGGMEVLFPRSGQLNVDPFSARLSYKSRSGIELETEAFNWSYKFLRARTALRGGIQFDEFEDPSARVEVSLTNVTTGVFTMEPFSLLLKSRSQLLDVVASPTGFHRFGTIWVEDFAANWNSDAGEGSGIFQLYGRSGNSIGSVEFDGQELATGGIKSSFSLHDLEQSPFLVSSYQEESESIDFQTEGTLLLSWINDFSKWWWGSSVTLRGSAPAIQMQLKGIAPFLYGQGLLKIDDISADLADGIEAEHIQADIDFLVNTFPRTNGPQQLRVARLSSGKVVMENVLLDWELRTLRDFRIQSVSASIGEGRISLDPFVMDPLDPVIQTRLRIEQLDGNALLRWLGEERFTIEGTVSGQISLGWEDGVFIIGMGSLSMDNMESGGRFIFSDADFIKERFGSFGGIPEDLKQRFQDALLSQGIRINSLTVELGPAPDPENFLLRLSIAGESKTDLLEVPIKGFVINNIISGEDLGHLLGLLGPVSIQAIP